ncbi:MAG: carboxylesterase family protein [Woeseiaceae bacterium]|nr:carboxylesterase family protein [Woeseiaceae bacterium]NIP20595.1 carboxylesterase family protein [Woeseiaceae bacterium]NIS89388.1 carboxylesterase family protein [Woeseiaceae bacterium]
MRLPVLLALVLCAAACGRAPSVDVDGEVLIGRYDNTVATFLGVPFAEPPVGELRWRAPQPLASKLARRDASQFAPACMQTMRILDWYRYMAETFGASRDYYDDLEISEDCLYLNVWTPSLDPGARLPVMVWIHGGSNKSGWSYEDNYRGNVLAPQGVIVVTLAYRHGAFGFLSHPELEGGDALANFGLWDILAGLRWIRDNIETFGGDPGRVTLFGESSGGGNILALMMSEQARGLFHRGILQSSAGYGLSMPTLEDEQRRGARLAELLGAATLEQLRQVDAQQLLDVYTANFDDYYHDAALDGQLLSVPTWDAIQSHDFGDQQLIIGTNDAEWLDSIDNDASVDDVILTARDNPRIGGEEALAWVAGEDDPRRAMDRLITAEAYLCPSQNVAANRSAAGGAAWMYFFTREREDEGGKKVGAFHGAEYSYVFGVHDDYMTTTDYDLDLGALMQRYWINFAATGDPNGDGLPRWPLFERPDPLVMELGDSVGQIPAIEPEMCAAFEQWNSAR